MDLAKSPENWADRRWSRFKTLQAIARQYAVSPECFGVVKVWRHREASAGSRAAVDDVVRFGRAAE